MKAIDKHTKAEIEVTPIKKDGVTWYVDTDDNTYSESELIFEEQINKDVDKFFDAFIKFHQSKQEQARWTEIRLQLVMKFVDIYQAPVTNMKDIFKLADKHINELKRRERV